LIQLLADENVPSETINLLIKQGIDIISINDFTSGLNDTEILKLPKQKAGVY
jgi:hypothetical protein